MLVIIILNWTNLKIGLDILNRSQQGLVRSTHPDTVKSSASAQNYLGVGLSGRREIPNVSGVWDRAPPEWNSGRPPPATALPETGRRRDGRGTHYLAHPVDHFSVRSHQRSPWEWDGCRRWVESLRGVNQARIRRPRTAGGKQSSSAPTEIGQRNFRARRWRKDESGYGWEWFIGEDRPHRRGKKKKKKPSFILLFI